MTDDKIAAIRAVIPNEFRQDELQGVFCSVLDVMGKRFSKVVDLLYPDLNSRERDYKRRSISRAYAGEYPYMDLKMEVICRLGQVEIKFKKEHLS